MQLKIGSVVENSVDGFVSTHLVLKDFSDLNSLVKYVNGFKRLDVNLRTFNSPSLFPVYMMKDLHNGGIIFISNNHSYLKTSEITELVND